MPSTYYLGLYILNLEESTEGLIAQIEVRALNKNL